MKHGLEIIGLALVDVYANNCMMLRVHQTPSTGELKLRSMTLVQHYIAVIKRYRKELLRSPILLSLTLSSLSVRL